MKIEPVLKALSILCILLIVILGIFFYRRVPRSPTPFQDAVKSDAFEITQGTHTVRLVHASSWTVEMNGQSLPADNDKATSALTGLATLQVEDQISDRADRAAEYALDAASGTKVTTFQKNVKRSEGLFGKQAPDFVHIYFSYVDKPGVYLGRGVMQSEIQPLDPNGWRSKDMTSLTEADIQTVTVATGKRQFTLTRSSDTWALDGKTVDSARVFSLLGTLAHLRADDFIDSSSPAPAAVSTMTVVGHGTTVLHVGATDPKTHRASVTIDNVPGGFWISDDKAKSILVQPSDFKPAVK